MTTEHDLDARLQAASGVSDADLPPMSDAFLDFLRNSDTAQADSVQTDSPVRPVRVLPHGAGEWPASVLASRQLVEDAHQRHGSRPFRRRAAVLLTAAVVGVAAAWTTAIVVTGADSSRPAPSAGGTVAPSNGITLVDAERATFPLSVDPEPAGLTPAFSGGSSSPLLTADYRAIDGAGFTLWLSAQDPRQTEGIEHPQDHYSDDEITSDATVTVGSIPAQLVTGAYDEPLCTYARAVPTQAESPAQVCTSSFADLIWERQDGQWAWIRGEDTYATAAAVLAVANSLVDRPQPVDLQLGLAPADWSLSDYDSSGFTLANDQRTDQRLSVSLLETWRGYKAGNLLDGMTQGAPVQSVTVQGQPAELVLANDGDGQSWYLGAQLPDGPFFLLQAPQELTQNQVLEIAERITYTP